MKNSVALNLMISHKERYFPSQYQAVKYFILQSFQLSLVKKVEKKMCSKCNLMKTDKKPKHKKQTMQIYFYLIFKEVF